MGVVASNGLKQILFMMWDCAHPSYMYYCSLHVLLQPAPRACSCQKNLTGASCGCCCIKWTETNLVHDVGLCSPELHVLLQPTCTTAARNSRALVEMPSNSYEETTALWKRQCRLGHPLPRSREISSVCQSNLALRRAPQQQQQLQQWRNVRSLAKMSPLGDKKLPLSGAPGLMITEKVLLCGNTLMKCCCGATLYFLRQGARSKASNFILCLELY